MSKKVSITLDDEVLEFVDQLSSNRSSFINTVLQKEKQQLFMKALKNAYKEQADDPAFQEEMAVWNVTTDDGLNA